MMLMKGRMQFRPHKIKGLEGLRKMVAVAEGGGNGE